MRTLGNIIWHVPFMGFISAFVHFTIGVLFIISIIGAPIGFGMVQYGRFLLTPFSSEMVSKNEFYIKQNKYWKIYSFIIWLFYLPVGLLLCFFCIIQIIALCLSILGIPLAIVLLKSLDTYFNPTDKICVSSSVGSEIERRTLYASFKI